jgi:hypothetical protein
MRLGRPPDGFSGQIMYNILDIAGKYLFYILKLSSYLKLKILMKL